MIGRLWRGATDADKAAAYEELLRNEVFPGIQQVAGARGAYLLRRELPDGVEFITLTLFESMDAVRAFAGEEYETAVIVKEAARLLREHDLTARHYEVAIAPE